MFTTMSTSGNSKRCGVSASRSFGPISASVLISAKVLSMTSRNSFEDVNEPIAATLHERRSAPDEVLEHRPLDRLAHPLGELEHEPAVVGRLLAVGGGLDRIAELDPPLRGQRH